MIRFKTHVSNWMFYKTVFHFISFLGILTIFWISTFRISSRNSKNLLIKMIFLMRSIYPSYSYLTLCIFTKKTQHFFHTSNQILDLCSMRKDIKWIIIRVWEMKLKAVTLCKLIRTQIRLQKQNSSWNAYLLLFWFLLQLL